MLILAANTDKINIITGSAGIIDAHASWMDNVAGAVVPGRTNTANINTAAVTTICPGPAVGVFRNIKTLHIRNRGTAANAITVLHDDGTTPVELYKVTIEAGAGLQYIDEVGFIPVSTAGVPTTGPGLPAGGQAGQWQLIEQKTVTGPVPMVTFTKGFDQTYDQFMFRIYNVHFIKPNSMRARVSKDGGLTWNASASRYQTLQVYCSASHNPPTSSLTVQNYMLILNNTADEPIRQGNQTTIQFVTPWEGTIKHGLMIENWLWHDTIGLSRVISVATWMGDPINITNFNGIQFYPGTTDSFAGGTFLFYGIKK